MCREDLDIILTTYYNHKFGKTTVDGQPTGVSMVPELAEEISQHHYKSCKLLRKIFFIPSFYIVKERKGRARHMIGKKKPRITGVRERRTDETAEEMHTMPPRARVHIPVFNDT